MGTTTGPLIIIGRGGFGVETLEVVRAINAAGGTIDVLGYADDDPASHGDTVLGIPVLGSIEATVRQHPDAAVVITIGNPRAFGVRGDIVARLGLDDSRYATLIHPRAVVPGSTSVGAGSVVHANVVMTADVVLGRHVVVMPSVVLTHGDRVSELCTFGSGAMLAGDVTVGTGAYIGAGALVREHLSVGPGSLVGMGAVVTRDIPAGEVWAGNPARFIRGMDG